MKSELENRLIAVVRVRGIAGVRKSINETLSRMNCSRVNSLSLMFGTKSNIGMIKKCNDFITYGPVSEQTVEKVIASKQVKVSKEDIGAVMDGKKRARDLMNVPIRLKPPRHGYEGIKEGFSNGGALGYRGEKINELISRMI